MWCLCLHQDIHLTALRRIIQYVLGTSEQSLFFPTRSPPVLQGYCDADWAEYLDTRHSITGWCMYLGNALISWRCNKQKRVSMSSMKAKNRAMSWACSEIIWLRWVLSELCFPQMDPTRLHANNTSTIQIAENPIFHERTKHIEVDCHFIHDAFDDNTISLSHVSTLQKPCQAES